MTRWRNAKYIKSWIYFYIFYLILSSYSVYMVVFHIGTIVQLGTLVVSAMTILFFIRDGIRKTMFCIPLIALSIFTAASLLTTTDTFATIMLLVRFLMVIYCVAILHRREVNLLRVIYQCLFFLMTFYFCCYVLFDVLSPDLGLSYIRDDIVNADGISTYRLFENHYNFYIRWVSNVSLFGIVIKRMAGFCWEAGQYQIYLNFVLMYLLFFDETQNRKKFKILFTTLNIVLCGSSMGFLTAVALFTIALMLQKNKVLRVLCFIPLLAIGGLAVLVILRTKSVNSVYSFTHRTSELGLIGDILFGNNVFGQKNIAINASNGLIRFLWAYGYIAIAAVICIAVCILKNKDQMRLYRQKIAFSIWLVLSLFNEPIEYFNFTFLIIAFVIVDVPGLNRHTAIIKTGEVIS